MNNHFSGIPQNFATKLSQGRWHCIRLYEKDGKGGSATIDIVKEVWFDIDGKQPAPFTGTQYPVFHVFNYVDPSKMFRPGWSGCRVNDYKKPFTTLDEAIALAEEHAVMCVESGLWVSFEDLDSSRKVNLGAFDKMCEELGISLVMV